MKRITILFLGGSKRVEMGRCFIAAARRRGYECRIVSYEISERAAIAAIGEVVVGLYWSNPDVENDLRRVCAEYQVDIVVPFVDGAVSLACRLKDIAFVPCGDEQTAKDMFDKSVAAKIFEKQGIKIPRTIHLTASSDPSRLPRMIAKPRCGSASKGIIRVYTDDQFEYVRKHSEDYLIQECLDVEAECSVDCYADPDSGEMLVISPRERLEVSGGEAVRTVTVDMPKVVELAREVGEKVGLRGAFTIQIIYSSVYQDLFVIEVNPRLGGGAVCSVAAGADIPALIIANALGERPQPLQAQTGVEIARYFAHTVFYPQ